MYKISSVKAALLAATGILFLGGFHGYAGNQPLMTIGKCGKPPIIDGIISKGEWDSSACGGGLSGIGSQRDELLGIQPLFYMAFDEEKLYIAAVVPVNRGEKLKADHRKRDSAIYRDDSVEFYFDPGRTKKYYYHFAVNSLGALFDGKNNRGAWTAKNAKSAAKVNNRKWIIELSIPFADLDEKSPREGDIWGMNIGLNYHSQNKITGTWAHLMSFHTPRNYGRLVFTRKGPVVAISGMQELAAGSGKISVRSVGRGKIESSLNIWPQDNKKHLDADIVKNGEFCFLPFKLGVAKQGKAKLYDGRLNIKTNEKELIFLPFSIRRTDLVTVQLNAFPDAEQLEVELLATENLSISKKCSAKVSIGRLGKQPVKTIKISGLNPQKPQVVIFNKNDVPNGKIFVKVNIFDKSGKNIFNYQRDLQSPLHPWWYNNTTGAEPVIPPPYKPLQTNGQTVFSWGRSYQLGECLLPQTVKALDASLLAGPVKFKTVANGLQLEWKGTAPKIVKSSPEAVVMTGKAQSKALGLTGRALIEYDGMIRLDLELTPQGRQFINELTLEIPFKTEYVKYLYYLGVKWGSVSNAGKFPEKGFESSFIPYVWLGDNNHGFSWFCESTKYWYPPDRKDAISIKREKKRVILRLHLIKNKEISNPLKYTFGFQATPIKAPDKTVWDYRISHHCAGYGIQSKPGFPNGASIKYPADNVIRGDCGTFEMWIRPSFDSDPAQKGKKVPDVPFFKLDIDPQTQYGLSWLGAEKSLCLWSSINDKIKKLLLAPVKWKKNSSHWHHVAFSWGDKLAIYIDGELVAAKPGKGLFGKNLENASIYIGNVGWNTCGAPEWVDEIRISDIARKPEISKQPYSPDKHTLLLDHLDQEIKTFYILESVPAVPTGYSGEFLGAPESGTGKYGQAVRLRTKQSLVSQLAAAGAKTLCIHSFWSWMGYPWAPPEKREYLRKLVKACHEKGIKLLVYSSPLTPDQAPEWDLYHKYFLIDPIKWPYRYAGGKHLAPACCWNCHYRNLRLAMQAKLIKDYDIDGFYVDSSEWPLKCQNRNHGCGYKNEKGEIIKTYNLFGTRDYMKRQYVLTKMLKPDGQVNVHNSAVMCTPTLGWCTSSWDGEQLDPRTRTGSNARDNLKYVLSLLPLDTFRAEFMGRQWGIPSELLCKEHSYTTPQLLAITLLHHVLVRPNPAHLGRISAIWRLHDEFDMKKSQWYPYWNNADIVKANAATVKVSAYRNPDKGFLMLVSNLSPDKRKVKVEFNAAKLNMSNGKLTAFDAISKRQINISKNIVRFEMKPFSYRYVWIK